MVELIQLKKGDIEAGTECQARDGNLNLRDWVVRCPECGSYTHKDCWVANGNKCPRQGCRGAGQVRMPAPVQPQTLRQQPARASQSRQQQPFQLPSRYLSSLQATGSSTSLLAQKCGRDGGRFLVGDKIVRCPRCGTPYHEHCWQANGNRCSQATCGGSALLWAYRLGQTTSASSPSPLSIENRARLTGQQTSTPAYEEGCFEQVLDLLACSLKVVGWLILIAICIGVVLFVLSALGIA